MTDRSSFGPALRRAREARGLTLEEIAEVTKVNAALYRGLENNDLSRWPSGLFRRGFLRSYAEAVGLDPEDTCRRFVRFFPEEGDAVPEMHAVPPPPAQLAPPAGDIEPPRLVLASVPPSSPVTTAQWRRIAAGVVDVGLAALVGAAAGAAAALIAGPAWFWTAAALCAATAHLAALAALGRTPGAWWLLCGDAGTQPASQAEPARKPSPEGPVLVASRRDAPRSAANTRAAAGRHGRR